MVRKRKLLLAAIAALSVVGVGGVLIVRALFGLISDEVDGSVGGIRTVSHVGQRTVEINGGTGQGVDRGTSGTAPGLQGANPGQLAPVVAGSKADEIPAASTQGAGERATNEANVNGGGTDRRESLGDMSGILSYFLNDGETEALSPDALLNPSNKSAEAADPGGLDGLLQMIPGADSPTLKAWDEGRYKGREGDMVDDAIEDPKIWRLVFSLGGM